VSASLPATYARFWLVGNQFNTVDRRTPARLGRPRPSSLSARGPRSIVYCGQPRPASDATRPLSSVVAAWSTISIVPWSPYRNAGAAIKPPDVRNLFKELKLLELEFRRSASSVFEKANADANLGQLAPRDREDVSMSLRAKRSRHTHRKMDCFAALAMTHRRMGRAKRNPSPSAPTLMGIASLHPSYKNKNGGE
jgi:hypothetical protein